MPYDSRPVTSEPLHRPVAAPPQFFTASPAPYSPGPMATTIGPSGYQPQAPPFTTYGSYPSSSLSTMVSPFKPQEPERTPQPQPQPQTQTQTQMQTKPQTQPFVSIDKAEPGAGGNAFGYVRGRRVSYVEGSRSPSVRSDGQLSSARSVSSNLSISSRTITSNIAVNGSTQANFNTCVDALMKTIQSKNGNGTIVRPIDIDHLMQEQSPSPPKQVSVLSGGHGGIVYVGEREREREETWENIMRIFGIRRRDTTKGQRKKNDKGDQSRESAREREERN